MTNVVFTVGLCGPDPKYKAAHPGVSDADSGYLGLMEAVGNFWRPRLPATFRLTMARWDRLTPDLVAGLPATAADKLVLVGHSLGGGMSLEVARALRGWGVIVNGLILVDPVNPLWDWNGAKPTISYDDGKTSSPLFKPYRGPWVGNTWDAIIPWNVDKAAAYYRGSVPDALHPSNVSASVWSFPIRGVESRIDPATGAVLRAPRVVANKCYGTPAPPKDPHGQWVWENETIQAAIAMGS